MNAIEEEFRQLVESLQAEHGPNLQRVLKETDVDDVAPEFRRSLTFWKSLSGPSRNFMFEVARGGKLNKKFAPDSGRRIALRPFNPLSRMR